MIANNALFLTLYVLYDKGIAVNIQYTIFIAFGIKPIDRKSAISRKNTVILFVVYQLDPWYSSLNRHGTEGIQ